MGLWGSPACACREEGPRKTVLQPQDMGVSEHRSPSTAHFTGREGATVQGRGRGGPAVTAELTARLWSCWARDPQAHLAEDLSCCPKHRPPEQHPHGRGEQEPGGAAAPLPAQAPA